MSDRTIEGATRGWLAQLPEALRGSPLAAVAAQLARSLDDEPAPTAEVLLARELRMTLADLRGQAGGDVNDEVDAFLGRIAASDDGHAAH
ncbi:MAG TPA: hypothetical protein VFH23_17100 [Jiangellaceae bacterium]|nr:hypothetical protein [Jiangellaceae bacterium]